MREISPSIPRISLNRTEVAISIGVSPNTVDLMVSEGMLPPPRKWHTRKIWLISEILASMAEWPSDTKLMTRTEQNNSDNWNAS